ncbi:MAG: response regulator [Sandaracinus sp.]|nr:response regulator [Sandaracinus sp.]MCB9623843.1 response regulator [Sandaracinus sp.]
MRPLVLVAEPDPFTLGWLEEACAAEGCEVVTALDGNDALAAIARETPALVIAASELPNVSGDELLEIVRRDPDLRPIAILLAGPATRATGTQPDARLSRPYRVTEVQARLRQMLASRLERRRRARESETTRRVGSHGQWKLALEQETDRALRHRAPLACVLVASESPARDAYTLAQLLRVVDEVFVVDGGRIGILLPETPADALATVEARIREALPDVRVASAALPDETRDPHKLEARAAERLGRMR